MGEKKKAITFHHHACMLLWWWAWWESKWCLAMSILVSSESHRDHDHHRAFPFLTLELFADRSPSLSVLFGQNSLSRVICHLRRGKRRKDDPAWILLEPRSEAGERVSTELNIVFHSPLTILLLIIWSERKEVDSIWEHLFVCSFVAYMFSCVWVPAPDKNTVDKLIKQIIVVFIMISTSSEPYARNILWMKINANGKCDFFIFVTFPLLFTFGDGP